MRYFQNKIWFKKLKKKILEKELKNVQRKIVPLKPFLYNLSLTTEILDQLNILTMKEIDLKQKIRKIKQDLK